jgi:hypothetical protein
MHQMRISTNQVSSVMFKHKKLEIRGENVKTVKEPIKTKQPWNEIGPNSSKDRAMHERRNPMPEGDNPSFWDEFIKFTFFVHSWIHIRIFKQVPKYLATGL